MCLGIALSPLADTSWQVTAHSCWSRHQTASFLLHYVNNAHGVPYTRSPQLETLADVRDALTCSTGMCDLLRAFLIGAVFLLCVSSQM